MRRTYEASISRELVNMYTWLGLQYAIWSKNKGQLEALNDITQIELSDYEKGLLKNLRVWIYEKREKALKDILKRIKFQILMAFWIFKRNCFKNTNIIRYFV